MAEPYRIYAKGRGAPEAGWSEVRRVPPGRRDRARALAQAGALRRAKPGQVFRVGPPAPSVRAEALALVGRLLACEAATPFFRSRQAFSSVTDEWATPDTLFKEVEAEFGPFDLDACATPGNAKARRYYTRAQDGLSRPWRGRVWMNPPYGREIGRWMQKAYESSLVVCLVPARTDTAWWHDYAMKGETRFIRGRLTFGGAPRPAPFPSALVVFRPA
jgi:phage N-6-adenine-methyltransferase